MNLPLTFVITFEVVFIVALLASTGLSIMEMVTGIRDVRAAVRQLTDTSIGSAIDGLDLNGAIAWGWVQVVGGVLNLLFLLALLTAGLLTARVATNSAEADSFPIVFANLTLEFGMLMLAAKSAVLIWGRRRLFGSRK